MRPVSSAAVVTRQGRLAEYVGIAGPQVRPAPDLKAENPAGSLACTWPAGRMALDSVRSRRPSRWSLAAAALMVTCGDVDGAVGMVEQARPWCRGAPAASDHPDRSQDRPPAVHVRHHVPDPYPAHLHQARRQHPGGPRSAA